MGVEKVNEVTPELSRLFLCQNWERIEGMKTLGTSHEKEEFDLGIERNCVIENHWIVLV